MSSCDTSSLDSTDEQYNWRIIPNNQMEMREEFAKNETTVLNKNKLENANTEVLADNSNTPSGITELRSMSMAFKHIDNKIEDVISENTKLKEALKHKDDAVRKQFNTAVILEKEVIKICESYKKRFFEAKKLVTQLIKENVELRTQAIDKPLSNLQDSLTSSYDSCNEDKTQQSEFTQIELQTINNSLTKSNLSLTNQVENLKEALENISFSHAELESKLENAETDASQFLIQLENSQRELEDLKKQLTVPDKSTFFKLVTENYKKELEQRYLVQVIELLKEKIYVTAAEGETVHGNDTSKLIKKLRDIMEYFIQRCITSNSSTELQAECENFIECFKKIQLPCSNTSIKTNLHTQDNAIFDYRNVLIDDYIQSIKDKRTTLNLRREYLKVLADYSKFSTELDLLMTDNVEVNDAKDTQFNNSDLAEVEKCLLEEKEKFDIEKQKLLDERSSIEREKELIHDERVMLSAEQTAFLEEKDELIAELNKKSSQESNVRDLKEKLDQVTLELNRAKKELRKEKEVINEIFTTLEEEALKLKEKDNEISAYKLQMDMQESDIFAMRDAEVNYLQQIGKLTTEIHQLRGQIRELQLNRNQEEPINVE